MPWVGLQCVIMVCQFWLLLEPSAYVYKHRYLNVNEYDQEIPHSYTADQPAAPQRRDTELEQPQDSRTTIKVRQPALSSLAKCTGLKFCLFVVNR